MIQKHLQLIDLFAANGLSDGYNVQATMWSDSGEPNDRFMVFKQAGGTNISLSYEQYVEAIVISKQGFEELEKLDQDVANIVEFIAENEFIDPCLGRMMVIGGIPSPASTNDKRVIYRLLIGCLNGQ